MNLLLVYPKDPDTFWSFKHALKFVRKRASNPPLGLLTVAAMLPAEWKPRLVDLNVEPLTSRHLAWADLVFLGAMAIHRQSVHDILKRCRASGKTVVAGGPLFTMAHPDFPEVAHFVLNEAELTLPAFLEDWKHGVPKPIYRSEEWADIHQTPIPRWDLVRPGLYASRGVQYSRGCPFHCEFCDITLLYGRTPRTKTAPQLLAELDALAAHGWKGSVFLVDDNFIGNKRELKASLLPALIQWQQTHHYRFSFYTQTSIDLADDPDLLALMTRAGFTVVFIGIETPNTESLQECTKAQNTSRDLLQSVRTIQSAGLQVQGGFIVGFDHDPESIFDLQVDFIQKSGIVSAMIGILNVLKGTRLHQRLSDERRLRDGNDTADHMNGLLNFQPKMNETTLLAGYRRLLTTVYSPAFYYRRVRQFLRQYQPPRLTKTRIRWVDVWALLRSVVRLGVFGKERLHYWRLLLWSLCRQPRSFPLAVSFTIYGFHFRKVIEQMAPIPA